MFIFSDVLVKMQCFIKTLIVGFFYSASYLYLKDVIF